MGRFARNASLLVILGAATGLFVAPTYASFMQDHGSFMGDFFTFEVVESTGTDDDPLYGAPIVVSTATADRLVFSPTADFSAESPNTAGSGDTTDGKLTIRIHGKDGAKVLSLQVLEEGDFAVLGPASAMVNAAGAIFAFDSSGNSLGSTDLVTSPLPGTGTSSDVWSGNGQISFGASGVDWVDVVIDNTLQATTPDGGAAFIAKKSFLFDVIVVPEPGTLLLLASGVTLLTLHRRKAR